MIKRLEALKDADFNADKDIYKALFADEYAARVEKLKCGPMGHRLTVHDYDGYIQVPAYTASIDAAMTLVPEGWSIGLGDLRGYDPIVWRAHLRDHNDPDPMKRKWFEGHAPTAAIALCIAALKAMSQ